MPPLEQAFLAPADPDAPIWKYMDRWKFTDVLESGLYFCRLDALPDPYEGSKTTLDHAQHLERYGKTVVDAAADFSTIHSLKRVMVNCWHMNTVESEGMWRLYVDEAQTGVCIQSTYARLRDCLGGSHRPSWCRHEQELRALIYDPDGDIPEKGVRCAVDGARLIERVVVSPYAEAHFRESVRQEVVRHSASIPVTDSALVRAPIR